MQHDAAADEEDDAGGQAGDDRMLQPQWLEPDAECKRTDERARVEPEREAKGKPLPDSAWRASDYRYSRRWSIHHLLLPMRALMLTSEINRDAGDWA